MERNVTIFVLGPYRLPVDVEKTWAWYDAHGEIAGGCGCAYCRNFAVAVETVSPEVRDFLDALGLDIRKPCEAMELGPGADGRRLYESFYHLSGTLESGAVRVSPGIYNTKQDAQALLMAVRRIARGKR